MTSSDERPQVLATDLIGDSISSLHRSIEEDERTLRRMGSRPIGNTEWLKDEVEQILARKRQITIPLVREFLQSQPR